LRTAGEDEDRSATWTELFFDLVFVAAVGRTTTILLEDQSTENVLWFGGLLTLISWSWVNYVFYSQRFDTDDLVHRLMKAAAMAGLAWLAVDAPTAPGRGEDAFVASWTLIRVVLVLLYVRALRHVTEARRAIRIYVAGFGSGALIWALSLLTPSSWRPGMWVLATLVEMFTPLLGWRAFGEAAVHKQHLEERCGLFTLIVLGQAVASIVRALATIGWTTSIAAGAAAAGVLVLCIWWLTFDYVEKGVPGEDKQTLAYVYWHIPVFVAIATIGVGLELALESSMEPVLPGAVRAVIGGGLTLYLLGIMFVRMNTGERPRIWVLAMHPGVAVLIASLLLFAADAPPSVLLVLIAAIVAADLVFKTRVHA
jgi:low temperature requirement protein LtrA